MNPDCRYCGFKDDKPHECFSKEAKAVIDERTSWYHEQWQKAYDLETQLSHLQKLVEEQKEEIEQLKLTPNQGHCCDGFCLGTCLEGTKLKSQLAEQKQTADKLESELELYKHKLAEQTERVRRLEEAIENYFKNYRCGEVCIEVEVANRLQKALQDSLGDGGKEGKC